MLKMKRNSGWRRRRVVSIPSFLIVVVLFTASGLLLQTLRSVDLSDATVSAERKIEEAGVQESSGGNSQPPSVSVSPRNGGPTKGCATVEEMGNSFMEDGPWKASLRIRKLIQRHFHLNGASRVRHLPPDQFCRHGFVLGKASEAGFGNEMYKILNAAALSLMLNRSLIVGQSRGKYPFGDYISYSNHTFTLKEVKHLWRLNGCLNKFGRHLVMRIDDFEKPTKSNVLCSNWMKWKQPIIWFQNTTDAVASQFFLKNVHHKVRAAASDVFGLPEYLHSRPNVFGELMRTLISPSEDVNAAVNWVIAGKADPDVTLHMRMLMNRSVRATRAALNCIRKALTNLHQKPRPRVVLVSDTPSFVKSVIPNLSGFAEVFLFDYKNYKGNISGGVNNNPAFRVKDWGPAPRWVAFVDFFLASRAKHAVVSGAHRRVGTTYAQLIAALAAANHLEENSTGSSFSFLSSFQSNLLADGLKLQIGWGHIWNRFAGPLSCTKQSNQCAFTPLLPPAWWDGLWQSPIPRDIRRLAAFGVKLSGIGTMDEGHLQSYCSSRKDVVKTVTFI
ncbi:hypothetical protein K2173_027113 [Erythroxylum novogranatense]|uniref:Transmembrane protein n=1 Tax=Erythroxylum novogranatense TaxID=1862640 RepID=A0AAV8TY75_9ROSI|nr:hypothetical protein K2173_027113 [Erythroxylum novogranatense]